MARKKKKKDSHMQKIGMGILGVIILVSSIAGVVLYNQPQDTNKITLNVSGQNVEFTPVQDYYDVKAGKLTFTAFNFPYKLDNIELPEAAADSIKRSSFIYLTFDPDSPDITYMDFFRFNLRESLQDNSVFFYEGVLTESDQYSLPIVDCYNATAYTPVIKLISSNTTFIKDENNCITIGSRGLGFIKARDKIIYSYYGVA